MSSDLRQQDLAACQDLVHLGGPQFLDYKHTNITYNYNNNYSNNLYSATYSAGWQCFTSKKAKAKYIIKYQAYITTSICAICMNNKWK